MDESHPSPEPVVGNSPTPPSPTDGDAGYVDPLRPFKENPSLSAENPDSHLQGTTTPSAETGRQQGTPAYSTETWHSLNSSLSAAPSVVSRPCAAARITAHTASATDIKLTIEPPSLEKCGGEITSYKLRYKKLESSGDWIECNTPNVPATYTIQDLQPATCYSIQAAVVTSCGYGPFSEPTKCTTQQVPSDHPKFRVFPSTDKILVKIEPPPLQSCNGNIIAYQIQHRVTEGNVPWEMFDAATAPNSSATHSIEHLQPATAYSIRVAAKNSSGCGLFSPTKKCTTLQAPQPPSAAPRFTTSSTTDTIRVEIEQDCAESLNTSAYKVQYKKRRNERWVTHDDVPTPHTIEGLTPGTSYDVRVAAVNTYGAGPFCVPKKCITKRGTMQVMLKVCRVAIPPLLLPLCLVPFLAFVFCHGTPASGEVLYKNGSLLIGNSGFNTFFKRAVHIETSATGTSGLSFFRHSCNNLPTTNSTAIQVVRKDQQLDTETNIPLYSEYLADGSTVCFHANISGERNLTDCAAAVYVMDNWNSYSSAFIDGNNITDSISKFCLNISSTDRPNLPQCFRVPHSGFFFFGAYIPGKYQGLGVELAVIQTVADKVLYNTSSLRPVCEIPSGDGKRSCTVKLSEEKVSTSMMKMCVLMTVQEESADIQTLSYSAIPITIKDFKHHLNAGTVGSLTFAAAATALFAVILALILVCVIVKCVRRRRRGYQPLQ